MIFGYKITHVGLSFVDCIYGADRDENDLVILKPDFDEIIHEFILTEIHL